MILSQRFTFALRSVMKCRFYTDELFLNQSVVIELLPLSTGVSRKQDDSRIAIRDTVKEMGISVKNKRQFITFMKVSNDIKSLEMADVL